MALLLFILIVKNIKLKKKITALAVTYSNMQRLLDFKDSAKPNNDMHQENFIKFLSDSRDWAFEYIESVQKGLDKFVSEVDASISYFDEYGEVLSINRPDYDSMKRISVAFKELKKLLPEEEKTK
jgi:hypothetical protein